jgi:hypothetical protein
MAKLPCKVATFSCALKRTGLKPRKAVWHRFRPLGECLT